MKLLAKGLAVAAFAAAAFTISERAEAQVQVDVDVSLGGITILYYHNNINVNVPDSVLATLLSPAACSSAFGSVNCIVAPPAPTNATSPAAGQLNWLGAISANPAPVPADLASIDLNLQNVWAVRAIGGSSANTTVTIAGTMTSIAGVAGSIGIVSRSLATGATATCAGPTTATFADPGLSTAVQGSVCLELNFSTALQGPFNGTGDTGDAVYTLQVTGT